jgi:glycogen debranching enzyme
VWPHDTAIATWGLAQRGEHAAAARLLRLLVDAAPHFRYRFPELYGGHGRREAAVPVPHPTACRPQAWAAAAGPLLVRACLGLRPALPDGRLVVAPLWPPPFEWLEVDGLPLGERHLSVRVDAERGVEVEVDGPPLDVVVQHPTG